MNVQKHSSSSVDVSRIEATTAPVERLFCYVVVAEGDVETHIARRLSVAIWTRADCPEFDFATAEA